MWAINQFYLNWNILQRAALENFSDDDDDDEYRERDDEKPTVVQLREGDLTEEEAARLAKGN